MSPANVPPVTLEAFDGDTTRLDKCSAVVCSDCRDYWFRGASEDDLGLSPFSGTTSPGAEGFAELVVAASYSKESMEGEYYCVYCDEAEFSVYPVNFLLRP